MHAIRAFFFLALLFGLPAGGAVLTVSRWESDDSFAKITRIQRDLRFRLNPRAQVHFRGSAVYDNATSRWSAAYNPDFVAVVVPATTEDVAVSVRWILDA